MSLAKDLNSDFIKYKKEVEKLYTSAQNFTTMATEDPLPIGLAEELEDEMPSIRSSAHKPVRTGYGSRLPDPYGFGYWVSIIIDRDGYPASSELFEIVDSDGTAKCRRLSDEDKTLFPIEDLDPGIYLFIV